MLKEVIRDIKRKDPADKSLFNNENYMTSFYGSEKICDHVKRFHFIHYVFKYKFLTPFLTILEKMFGKWLIHKVPDKPQFKYIKLFEDVFDKSVIDWDNIYINGINKANGKPVKSRKQIVDEYNNTGRRQFLKTMKNMVTTMCCNDDAYAELIPFLAWNFYFKMQDMVNEKDTIHILRNDLRMESVKEILYLSLMKQIKEGNISFVLKESGKQGGKK